MIMKKLALTLVLASAVFGCSNAPSLGLFSGSHADSGPPALKGPAPDFELENVAGGKTKASDLRGRVLVVDFWATWCEPCIMEIPKFNKMAEEFKGKDVEIVGITVESAHADIKPKVKETGMKYTVLVGNDAVVDGFGGLVGFPTTFVVTKDWKIYKKYMGALPDKDMRIRKDIEKLLAEDSGTSAD
jgi:cytochrome c biogenesis protein CcmG/thiol:disulfide interchange protein DsbE